MAGPCDVPADCINWSLPDDPICDPCIDLSDTAQFAEFTQAWKLAVAQVYRRTCWRWTGSCFIERTRPCINSCPCARPRCHCGAYTYLDVDPEAHCLPVAEVLAINIAQSDCPPHEAVTLTEGDGYRVERGRGRPPRIVLESADGCCGRFPTQDLCVPDGGIGSWSIDLRTGEDPPPDVRYAASALASEIVKECRATGCTLARGARQVTTRGVVFTQDRDNPPELWLAILNDIYDQYGCTDADHYASAAPGGYGPVSWHQVFGPTPIRDCDHDTCGVDCREPVVMGGG